MISDIIKSFIEENIEQGNFSACAVGVQQFGERADFLCMGRTSDFEDAVEIDAHSLFDLSSLTKVIFTTTWVARLMQNANLPIKIPICKMKQFADVIEHIRKAQYLDITIEDILLHRAGFPAIAKYAELGTSKTNVDIIRGITSIHPEYERGKKTVYSDLGFIFLAELLSLYTKKDLEDVWANDLQKTMQLPSIKTTQQLTDKDVVVQSSPKRVNSIYDPGVRYFQRLCGHAGLWGSIHNLILFGDIWLQGYVEGDANLRNKTARAFIDPYVGQERKLGWDIVSENSTAGRITKSAIGHLGYTGTSLWIDLEKQVVVGLLTNRTYSQLKDPDELVTEKQKIDFNEFRKNVHNEVWRTYT